MKKYLYLIFVIVALSNCKNPTTSKAQTVASNPPISCSEKGCVGEYFGPEFINGSDVAHQFSNTMSQVVGDKLKELYTAGSYSQVDFKNISMTTVGMGSGKVTYHLSIPFKKVSHKCDAYTSFDHVGGWNHAPALAQRKQQLSRLLLDNDLLQISDLKKTPEGLVEYWIQWRHMEVQKECESP